nr:hypothetical protein [Alphaproteobacteria bacterium]
MTQQAQWVSPRSESWRYSAAAISKWEHHLWVSGEAPSVQADQPVAVTPIDHASFRAAFDDVVAGLPSFDQQTPFDMSAAIAGHLFPHQALLGDGHAIRINASTDDTRARGANDDGSASGVLEVHLTLPASAEWSGNARTENAGTKNARTENARTENAGIKNARTENAGTENAGIKNARTENAGIKNVRTENTHTENPNTEVAATQTGEQSPGEQISLAVRHNLMITIGRDDRATRREATGEPGEPVEHRVRLFLHSESAVWDQQ